MTDEGKMAAGVEDKGAESPAPKVEPPVGYRPQEPGQQAVRHSKWQLFGMAVFGLGLLFIIFGGDRFLKRSTPAVNPVLESTKKQPGGMDSREFLKEWAKEYGSDQSQDKEPKTAGFRQPPKSAEVERDQGQRRQTSPEDAAFDAALSSGLVSSGYRGRVEADDGPDSGSALEGLARISGAIGRVGQDAAVDSSAPVEVQRDLSAVTTASLVRRGAAVIPRNYVIKARLMNGINSDLGGTITAMVEQDILIPQGEHMWLRIIPQGSKFYGLYDANLVVGQNRLAMVVDSLEFPNGAVYSFGDQTVADAQGATGVRDRVNHHAFRALSRAFALGLIGASFEVGRDELDQGEFGPFTRGGNDLVDGIERVAQQLLERDLSRQPTIMVDAGLEVTIITRTAIELPQALDYF